MLVAAPQRSAGAGIQMLIVFLLQSTSVAGANSSRDIDALGRRAQWSRHEPGNHPSRADSSSMHRVAVCITGLYRAAPSDDVLPHIQRMQYSRMSAAFFVVTDHVGALSWNWTTRVTILPQNESSQYKALVACSRSVEDYESATKSAFSTVIRQRIDVLGCTPPVSFIDTHLQPFVLVPFGACGYLCDNWVMLSRSALTDYVSAFGKCKVAGGYSIHKSLQARGGCNPPEVDMFETLVHKVDIWFTVGVGQASTCFKIIRTGRRTRANVNAYNMMDYDIHQLPSSFYAPVTFHTQLNASSCRGG